MFVAKSVSSLACLYNLVIIGEREKRCERESIVRMLVILPLSFPFLSAWIVVHNCTMKKKIGNEGIFIERKEKLECKSVWKIRSGTVAGHFVQFQRKWKAIVEAK
jgi:hypothetical protein